MDKWKSILLILLVIAVLVILLRMSKIMQLQNSTLLSVANKLGIEPLDKRNLEEEEYEEYEDEEECEECEKEKKKKNNLLKESEKTDDSESEQEGGKIDANTVKVKRPQREVPGEPKVKRSEIFSMVIDVFKDGMPRKRKDLEVQIDFPGRESKGSGYMADIIQTMKTKGMLGAQFFDLGDKWKSYYLFGLPEWFSDGKLKPEYAEKIGLDTENVEEATVIEDQENKENI